LDDAKWAAYENAGGAVLIIILIILVVVGIAMWRQRRKTPAYQALSAEEAASGRNRRGGPGDLEAAAFDESELDDLHLDTPTAAGHSKYSVGDDSEDEAAPTTSKEKARGS
jgi:carboxypeptidase D